MNARPFSLVPPPAESPATRAARLMAEARGAAAEQIQALEEALQAVSTLSAEVADGGEAYPIGARDLARRMSEDAVHKLQTLEAILTHAR